ncbi:hypothetical protein E2C01_085933 [Portunus trituberculatus]|uniref:Uncharacterized protein n=1 Tax=Portunus trituberculatus TaxID=210409 RepID=A0A5B7J7Z3_PORTR|nr:hypothetical protein [Portunus trituberculatus]
MSKYSNSPLCPLLPGWPRRAYVSPTTSPLLPRAPQAEPRSSPPATRPATGLRQIPSSPCLF